MWQWKDEFPELLENRTIEIERLKSLGGRQPELLESCDDVIQKWAVGNGHCRSEKWIDFEAMA